MSHPLVGVAVVVAIGFGLVSATSESATAVPPATARPLVAPKKPPLASKAAKPRTKPVRGKASPKITKPKSDEKIHITSDYMKYDRKAKIALATGHVVIVQDDTTISTIEVQFDQGRKVSYMNQPVHVRQHKEKEAPTTLDAKRMITYHKEKRMEADGDVKFIRSKDPLAKAKGPGDRAKMEAAIKKEDTVITSESLEYWTQRKDALFKRNVIIINDKKKAWGDTAFMDNATNTITLDGHVKVVQINGNWLVKEGLIRSESPDEERDEALRERSSLTSDKLVMDQNTNDAVATGEVVRVEQKGKVATGRKAVFSDHNNTITMTENVRIQQVNGDWLTATKAIFYTKTEVFEAFSGGDTQVQTEFDVPDDTKKEKKSDRVEMEFDVKETEK